MTRSTALIAFRPSFSTANKVVTAECQEKAEAERSSTALWDVGEAVSAAHEVVGRGEQEVEDLR
jgi:hypothetical protein